MLNSMEQWDRFMAKRAEVQKSIPAGGMYDTIKDIYFESRLTNIPLIVVNDCSAIEPEEGLAYFDGMTLLDSDGTEDDIQQVWAFTKNGRVVVLEDYYAKHKPFEDLLDVDTVDSIRKVYGPSMQIQGSTLTTARVYNELSRQEGLSDEDRFKVANLLVEQYRKYHSIGEDGLVNIDKDFKADDVIRDWKLIVRLGVIKGSFKAFYLMSLQGVPKHVIGDFSCRNNNKFSEEELRAVCQVDGAVKLKF